MVAKRIEVKWEYISDGVYRFAVPGGWLYRFRMDGHPEATQMTFVPGPPMPPAQIAWNGPYPYNGFGHGVASYTNGPAS